MRREAITLRRCRDRILRFVDEETLHDDVKDPDAARANGASMRAHRGELRRSRRAEQLGWIELGPDVLHEVSCCLAPKATVDQLKVLAPTLAAAGLLSRLRSIVRQYSNSASEQRSEGWRFARSSRSSST